MRSKAAQFWAWIRRHALLVGLLAIGAIAIAGTAWFVIDRARQPAVTAQGHQAYVVAQQHVHVQEARAQLAVVANALTADRPTSEVASRVQWIRDSLSVAMQPSTEAGDAWAEISGGLDRLVEQIRREDPGAVDTVDRVRALLTEAGGGS